MNTDTAPLFKPKAKPFRDRQAGRRSDILNRAYTKQLALKISHELGRPFTRVGDDFLDEFADEARRLLRAKIHRHPSKGVTLKASFSRAEV